MRCSRGDGVMYPEEDSECWQDEGHRQGCNQTCHVEESQGPRAEVASGLDLNLWRAVVCSGLAHGLGRAGWVWGKCYPACCHCWLGLVYGVHMGEGWYHPRHAAPPQHMTSPNLNRGICSPPHPLPRGAWPSLAPLSVCSLGAHEHSLACVMGRTTPPLCMRGTQR